MAYLETSCDVNSLHDQFLVWRADEELGDHIGDLQSIASVLFITLSHRLFVRERKKRRNSPFDSEPSQTP